MNVKDLPASRTIEPTVRETPKKMRDARATPKKTRRTASDNNGRSTPAKSLRKPASDNNARSTPAKSLRKPVSDNNALSTPAKTQRKRKSDDEVRYCWESQINLITSSDNQHFATLADFSKKLVNNLNTRPTGDIRSKADKQSLPFEMRQPGDFKV